jgi:hypothetical protein
MTTTMDNDGDGADRRRGNHDRLQIPIIVIVFAADPTFRSTTLQSRVTNAVYRCCMSMSVSESTGGWHRSNAYCSGNRGGSVRCQRWQHTLGTMDCFEVSREREDSRTHSVFGRSFEKRFLWLHFTRTSGTTTALNIIAAKIFPVTTRVGPPPLIRGYPAVMQLFSYVVRRTLLASRSFASGSRWSTPNPGHTSWLLARACCGSQCQHSSTVLHVKFFFLF